MKNKSLYICLVIYISFIFIFKHIECGKFEKFEYRGRQNMLFIPDVKVPGAPLIVMIHGCTQSPIDIAESTRMVFTILFMHFILQMSNNLNKNMIAELINGYVLYPEQRFTDNPSKVFHIM